MTMTLTHDGDSAGRLSQRFSRLSPEFWASRDSLRHIHQAADSRAISPDAVLGAVLARLSSFMPPTVRIDTGQDAPASLNVFTALIGRSSSGKSRAYRCARSLLAVPQAIAGQDDYRDSLPLGSGEGIAEAFYGDMQLTVPNAAGTGTKTIKQRGVIRENVSFYADEGEQLSKMMERSGSTIGQVLRTAWIGDGLGQANASADRQRYVPAGDYSLGMVISYQHSTVRPMLADGGGGTPQRFLFLSAHREPLWEKVTWPGELAFVVPSRGLVLPEEAQTELWVARNQGMSEGAPDEGLNGHEPLHLAKMSALLCILEGRTTVSIKDWGLAHEIWAVSCAVRDRLVDEVAEEGRVEAAAREEAVVRTASRSAVASGNAIEEAHIRKVDRVALGLARTVWQSADSSAASRNSYSAPPSFGITGKDGLKQTLASRDRKYLTEGLAEGEARGWLVVHGSFEVGLVGPGAVRPPS